MIIKNNKDLLGKRRFNNKSIKKMEQLILDTKSNKKEFSGTLCADQNNKINLTDICSGNLCSVLVTDKQCKSNNNKPIGSYHTHYGSEHTEFSVEDLESHILSQDLISCIGLETKGVLCIVSITNQLPDKSLRILNKRRNKLYQKYASKLFNDKSIELDLINIDKQITEKTKQYIKNNFVTFSKTDLI